MWSSSIATLRTVRGSWSCSVDFFSTPSTTHDLPRTPTWSLAKLLEDSSQSRCRCPPRSCSLVHPSSGPDHGADRCLMPVAELAEQAIGRGDRTGSKVCRAWTRATASAGRKMRSVGTSPLARSHTSNNDTHSSSTALNGLEGVLDLEQLLSSVMLHAPLVSINAHVHQARRR